jgi:hypothetical protein
VEWEGVDWFLVEEAGLREWWEVALVEWVVLVL